MRFNIYIIIEFKIINIEINIIYKKIRYFKLVLRI
jgi:hypothetical protein